MKREVVVEEEEEEENFVGFEEERTRVREVIQ